MNLKKYFVISIVLFTFALLLSPINAFDIQKIDKNTVTYNNGKSVVTTSIIATSVGSDSFMKKDLNRIDKIVVKIDGKTVNIIKKGKGWSKSKYYPVAIIDRTTVVKGNIKNKNITILTYDNKNKLIKSKTNNITSIYIKPKLTKTQATKLGNTVAKNAFSHTKYDVKVVSRNTILYGNKVYWSFDVYDKKTNKWLDSFLMDEKGQGTKF